MAVRTYDPKQVVVLIGGVPVGGFADGTFLNVTRTADTFTKHVGADGNTSRTKSSDRSGEMTITLAQTSPSNDVLSGFALADELSNNGIVPILIKDLSGRTALVSAFGWIRKMPDVEFGKEVADRAWVFDLADIETFIGGNQQAE